LSRLRTNTSDFLLQVAPGDTGALMSGLVTGDDGALTTAASDAFLSSGTTHITAISGSNFAVLTMLLAVLATGGMRRSIWFVAAATTTIWLYAVMVGLQPSAFRAALLASVVLLGRWLGRKPDLLTLTVILASVQIMLRPGDFHTLGFQLSIAATLALIVVFDGSERMGQRPWWLAAGLCVIAAQLATMPILAARIGTLSGIGVFANLVIGPLATLAFPVALIGAMIGQLLPWLGELVLIPATWIARAMIEIVRWSDRHLPATVGLGHPVPAAIGMLFVVCWLVICSMSGDLQRMARHAWGIIRNW
jgi:competence protein ComEC